MHDNRIKIISIMWGSYLPTFLDAARQCEQVKLTLFANKEIENDAGQLEAFLDAAKKADILFFYWTTDTFWEEVSARLHEIGPGKIIITTSFDPADWGRHATVELPVCARAYGYLAEGGAENYRRLLDFLAHKKNPAIPVADPVPIPWQGIFHPPTPVVYDSVATYRAVHPATQSATVGLFFSRHTFTNTDGALEKALIDALNAQGVDVLPVFSNGTSDPEAGSLGPIETARQFFFDPEGQPRIAALINLHYFFLGREAKGDISETGVAAQSVELFKSLNVPVFKPVVSYRKSISEWEEDPQGLIAEVSFGIAMPEFEGHIEPIIVACSRKLTDERTGTFYELREVIAERVDHIAERVARYVRLSAKPFSERKAVFVFHKNECAGLEASIGGAAGLDSGESVVQIMRRMQDAGYRVEDIPESGEALMQTIMAKKAIAEFRWTTVDEIVKKDGHLALLDNKIYLDWYKALPEKTRSDLVTSWGEPPGTELNGVPPAMILDGKIVITGLNFGNVNVIMQPKRGCAGARCDGQVCKILHDPDIPPPHQYLATYRYMDKVFGADVIIHVGTHGNLEFMPGKGAGLSSACWPDIAIGTIPHLYIYNADNPAEGVIAKRRSYATLVDHLQAVMSTSDTYGGLEDLEELLEEYHRAATQDPARAHQLEHLIREAMEASHLSEEVAARNPATFVDEVIICHEILSRVKNSQTMIGMHVFGDIPEGEEPAEIINTILRFDSNNELNTRRLIFDLWDEDIAAALESPGKRGKYGQTYGDLLYSADRRAMELIGRLLSGESRAALFTDLASRCQNPAAVQGRFERFADLTFEIDQRLSDSTEIDSLLNAMNGGHVAAGPSGYLSRGRYDILPTGRNFYNVDPTRIPTQAAWRVGVRLAEALIARYQKDEGRFPETVGMVWLASDIMRADGEQIGQILHLLGLRPRWKANAQVDGIEIIPPAELGRPRIDVNIRVSGITRDCFPDSVKYVDQAVQSVAMLEESPEENLVRKHIVEQAKARQAALSNPEEFRKLSYRIFCAQPGVYKAGVNLAVYASAWKTENDLSDIYLFWNGYAYGGGAGDAAYGVQAHKELVENLRRVEVTFDKHISDEGDFLNCCGYFGNYGGMSVAAKTLSGKKPRTYYGDTRDPAQVGVTDFADEMRRVVRAKLLNPKYIEGMQEHGYKGAGDLSKRIGRVYGFAATTGEVDGWIFDEIAETFVLNEEMREWFQKVNPWALEEIGRRLLEAQSREIWNPDKELLERLKDAYLEVEGSIEDTMGEITGEFQGGSVDIMTADDVGHWKAEMGKILDGLGIKK
ncbi:MAG: cobaltochelatase subunit CobN [Desulfurivibrionaceae bacterium]